MSRYLYGAAVQGIQGYIFRTNELKKIVESSEEVELICSSQNGGLFNEFVQGGESFLRAAGNIKHVFPDRKSCEDAVRNFPRKVMEYAPGITLSQAVVEIKEGAELPFDELEQKLRMQRNCPMPSMTTGYIGIERDPKTALPSRKEPKANSQTTRVLCEKAFGRYVDHDDVAYDIENITDRNSWIAIIHADGNGLGQVVKAIARTKYLAEFSKELDNATVQSAVAAYNHVIKPLVCKKEPVRPIVLGGDDFTAICRADLAVEYVKVFMETFEKITSDRAAKMHLDAAGLDKLTMCAGIAFVKQNYPFYYGYDLAETLCGEAKKAAKAINPQLAPSCLMFHKVQDSFVGQWSDIKDRDLRTSDGLSFENGPYYIEPQLGKSTIGDLLSNVDSLDDNIKARLRQWLTVRHEDAGKAKQEAGRIIAKYPKYKDMLAQEHVCPVYDILALASVKYQKTKEK